MYYFLFKNKQLHPKAVKYVFFDEIRDTFNAGKSIVIYQHTNRNLSFDDQIQSRIEELIDCLLITENDISIVYTKEDSSRFYIIIKHPQHSDEIEQNLKFMENVNPESILSIHKKNYSTCIHK